MFGLLLIWGEVRVCVRDGVGLGVRVSVGDFAGV